LEAHRKKGQEGGTDLFAGVRQTVLNKSRNLERKDSKRLKKEWGREKHAQVNRHRKSFIEDEMSTPTRTSQYRKSSIELAHWCRRISSREKREPHRGKRNVSREKKRKEVQNSEQEGTLKKLREDLKKRIK